MSERASTEVGAVPTEIQKEAVDALALLKESEAEETFDYFKALVKFQKQASINERVQ